MAAGTPELIRQAIAGLQAEVPALAKLKLVVGLELRGRGDVQQYRIEVPGPKIARDVAADARVRLSLPRASFNELARDGDISDWREAFLHGQAKATGPPEILQLIERVVDRQ